MTYDQHNITWDFYGAMTPYVPNKKPSYIIPIFVSLIIIYFAIKK